MHYKFNPRTFSLWIRVQLHYESESNTSLHILCLVLSWALKYVTVTFRVMTYVCTSSLLFQFFTDQDRYIMIPCPLYSHSLLWNTAIRELTFLLKLSLLWEENSDSGRSYPVKETFSLFRNTDLMCIQRKKIILI